jgi:hypothetical protein
MAIWCPGQTVGPFCIFSRKSSATKKARLAQGVCRREIAKLVGVAVNTACGYFSCELWRTAAAPSWEPSSCRLVGTSWAVLGVGGLLPLGVRGVEGAPWRGHAP